VDPDACLQRILDAFTAKEWGEFEDAVDDLAHWLDLGGFRPTALAHDEEMRAAVLDGAGAIRELLTKRAVEKVLGGRVLGFMTLDEINSRFGTGAAIDADVDEETH
jgi:hypothetical protein